jgi:hypothetical protein
MYVEIMEAGPSIALAPSSGKAQVFVLLLLFA